MKHNFFLTLTFVLLAIFVLIGIKYDFLSPRPPVKEDVGINIVKTMAVSRSSVERQNQENVQVVSSSNYLNDPVGDDLAIETSKELRLLTFNIRHGVNEKGEESLDSIIQSIKETKAEIIALQEVDRFMPRSGFKDQAKEIAKALGYNYVYGETINLLGIKYGNAILSAYPIVEHENHKLYSKEIETRGLLKVVINIDGLLYHVYTTHLGLNSEERIKQIEQINDIVESDSGERIILMGDFNEESHTSTMQQISNMLIDSTEWIDGDIEFYTYAFYSDKPNTRIDRIYVGQNIEILDHYVIETETSDHCMVVAVISHNKPIKEGIMTFTENE